MSELLKDKTVKGIPIQDKVMNSSNNTEAYLVYVKCMTFNHAPYIVDAMDGFCIQNTNFPYVCVVIDDASTDGEQDEIRNYLQDNFDLEDTNIVRNEETEDYVLTFARHKTNHNCFFAVYLLKYNHYSIRKSKDLYLKEWKDNCKYIALCEGDDYWTDSDKLQIQVNFLESHSDYSMCFHDVHIKAEKGREWYDVFGKLENRDYTGVENLIKWSGPTCSMVLRNEVYDSIPMNPKFTMGDNVLVLTSSQLGKVRCIPKKMGVYRLTPTSWIGGQSNKVQRYKYISHYLGLIEEFEECRCTAIYNILENQYFQLLAILKHEGNKEEFERVKAEYLKYPGENHISHFSSYYFKGRIRGALKSLLGQNCVKIYRNMKK